MARKQNQQQRVITWDGASFKSVPVNELPDGAWTWYTPHVKEDAANVETYYNKVAWLNRGVALRAQAVSTLPFAILTESGDEYDISDAYENKLEFLPQPTRLLYLIEAALTLLGKAYLFRERNKVATLDLRYVVPASVEPVVDAVQGLRGFKRCVGSHVYDWTLDDCVYFWALDPFVELGPGNNPPATAALSAAGVLFNVDKFASAFFERGAVKATLLAVKGSPGKDEKERIEQWWRSFMSGIRNAFSTKAVIEADAIVPVTVGEGIKELSDTELTKEKREDIAAALGVPMTLLWSTQASGLGGGGVVQQDDLNFYDKTIVPEAKFIQGVLNEQVFEPLGYRFEFRPESLDVFQADENERAQAFAAYVNGGLAAELVGEMLGLELPGGKTWEEFAAEKEERRQRMAEQLRPKTPEPPVPNQPGQPPAPNQPPQPGQPPVQNATRAAMLADLKRWRTKALKKGGDVSFESEFIPPAIMGAIHYYLGLADDDEDIRRVFAEWEGQPAGTVDPFPEYEGYRYP